jgi:hypothetical protein
MERTLVKVRSHTVTLDYNGGDGLQVQKEEAYATLRVSGAGTRGQDREIQVSMDRYRHSEGMSEWRWYMSDIEPSDGIGEVVRGTIRDEIAPLIEGWLDGTFGTEEGGPEARYFLSRARAFRWALVQEVRCMRTTADYRAKEALAKFGAELLPSDREKIEGAHSYMATALYALEFNALDDTAARVEGRRTA